MLVFIEHNKIGVEMFPFWYQGGGGKPLTSNDTKVTRAPTSMINDKW